MHVFITNWNNLGILSIFWHMVCHALISVLKYNNNTRKDQFEYTFLKTIKCYTHDIIHVHHHMQCYQFSWCLDHLSFIWDNIFYFKLIRSKSTLEMSALTSFTKNYECSPFKVIIILYSTYVTWTHIICSHDIIIVIYIYFTNVNSKKIGMRLMQCENTIINDEYYTMYSYVLYNLSVFLNNTNNSSFLCQTCYYILLPNKIKHDSNNRAPSLSYIIYVLLKCKQQIINTINLIYEDTDEQDHKSVMPNWWITNFN